MDNLGYCCINQELRKQKVYTSRSLIRRTFSMEKASNLALQNCYAVLMGFDVHQEVAIPKDIIPEYALVVIETEVDETGGILLSYSLQY
jgi:hypothetical protein